MKYSAHITTTNYKRIGMYDANNIHNSFCTTSKAAKQLNAIICTNGDYSYTPGIKPSDYAYGIARRGVVKRPDYCYAIGLYNNTTGMLFKNQDGDPCYGKPIIWLTKKKMVTDTICFYFTMPVKDGESQVSATNYDKTLRPRTLIGTNEKPGDIWIVVADGDLRDGKSIGLNQKDRADFLLEKGCTLGFGMDGGGSSTMVFCGVRLTSIKANHSERAVVDFFFAR